MNFQSSDVPCVGVFKLITVAPWQHHEHGRIQSTKQFPGQLTQVGVSLVRYDGLIRRVGRCPTAARYSSSETIAVIHDLPEGHCEEMNRTVGTRMAGGVGGLGVIRGSIPMIVRPAVVVSCGLAVQWLP